MSIVLARNHAGAHSSDGSRVALKLNYWLRVIREAARPLQPRWNRWARGPGEWARRCPPRPAARLVVGAGGASSSVAGSTPLARPERPPLGRRARRCRRAPPAPASRRAARPRPDGRAGARRCSSRRPPRGRPGCARPRSTWRERAWRLRRYSSGPSRSSTTMPSSARRSMRSRRPRSGAGAPPATRAAWRAAGSDRRSPSSFPRASILGRLPSTGRPRRMVPSPATGQAADERGGPVLDHADLEPVGEVRLHLERPHHGVRRDGAFELGLVHVQRGHRRAPPRRAPP